MQRTERRGRYGGRHGCVKYDRNELIQACSQWVVCGDSLKLRRQDIRVKFLADPGPDVKRNPRVGSLGCFRDSPRNCHQQPFQCLHIFLHSFARCWHELYDIVCLAQVPRHTWAITPDDPEAMNPPCKEDLDQKSVVDFHPMVTMHLFRR